MRMTKKDVAALQKVMPLPKGKLDSKTLFRVLVQEIYEESKTGKDVYGKVAEYGSLLNELSFIIGPLYFKESRNIKNKPKNARMCGTARAEGFEVEGLAGTYRLPVDDREGLGGPWRAGRKCT